MHASLCSRDSSKDQEIIIILIKDVCISTIICNFHVKSKYSISVIQILQFFLSVKYELRVK